MIVSVHQPQYLPWLGYFAKIARSDCFVFLDTVQYKEREFQNRNKIRTRNGPLWLTVPVISGGRQRIDLCKIDNSQGWQRQHLESIRFSYSRSAFFKDHRPFLEEVYTRPWQRLVDLNVHIITYILREFNITTPVKFESQLLTTTSATGRIIEICRKLRADTYLSGSGGKAYLDEEKFRQANINLRYQEFSHPAYRQQFIQDSADFMPYMAAIDLLFNQGPASREILGV